MLNHTGTINLETERLVLRRFKEADADDMYANWASDPNVTKYLTWPNHNSIESSMYVIGMWLIDYESVQTYQWAIQLKEHSHVVGSISLMNIDNPNENCEIGYCIGQSYWNKGIVTEAFLRVIDFAFKDVGFQRITGRHDIQNPASGRVMEKCGLRFEGVLRKISKNNQGILVDCKYYSILKDEHQTYRESAHDK